MIFNFQKKYSLKKRKKECDRILTKYSNRIAIIVEKLEGSEIEYIDKHKFLVPKDLTVSQFSYVIRKRIKLHDNQSLLIFINGNYLAKNDETIRELYEKHKAEDNFLYIVYTGENTFG